jgi:hypothetical protein
VIGNQTTTLPDVKLAAYQTLTISGYVRDQNGNGVPNVTMNGFVGYPQTDTNGFYSGTIKWGWTSSWSGNIIPGKSGYVFTPALRSYSNISTDQTNQDFIIDVPTPLYYEQFSGSDLDLANWRSWQIREIRDFNGERKLFSKTEGIGISNSANRLEFKNPSSIIHIEADVTITELEGNYGPNGNNYTALPNANLAGIFYNDGTGSTGGYLGDVLALIRILPGSDQQHLISHWSVIKYTNSVGSSWEILGTGILSNSLPIDQTYRLSLDWNESSKTFTFWDGVSNPQNHMVQDTLHPPKINWKALRTMVSIGDATHSVTAHDVSDPTLWGKISATFDNVKVVSGGPIYDDFSSAQLDSSKWDTFELSSEVINGQMISQTRVTNSIVGISNNVYFKNPELITEFQAKVTLKDYISNNTDTGTRIGGTFFNDTGDPNSGSQRDIYAQVYFRTLGQAPYAAWVVLRFKDPLALTWDVLGYGTFPLPINLNQAYTLYMKWDGQQFIFKCDEYAASYRPPVPVFQPNVPSRNIATGVGTVTPYADFNGYVKAAFDDLIVSGVAQLTPKGTNVNTQPLDPTTGNTPVIINFGQVTQVGVTSLTTSTSNPPPIPEGYLQLGNTPTYYDISTTATFTGPIDVAIHYAGVLYTDESALRLLHYENGSWVDCTTSIETTNKIIHGTVNSLSPFVIVEIANRPPVLAHIGDQIVNEGQLMQIVLSATDPDGNPLTYSASNLPTGATLDPATQTFSWTPNFNQAGSYPNVLFTVTDNGTPPLSAQEAITITVNNVNRPPVLNPIGNKSVNEGEFITFKVSATDPDGDTLALAIGNLPRGASFDPATGTFSWIPNYKQSGNYLVTFTATDNGTPPLSDSEDITITVNNINRPPVLTPIGNKTVNENQLLEFIITATDPDGDALTYKAGNLPPGASFDPVTQTFSWIPSFDQSGNYTIEFSVEDNGSPMAFDAELITITVNNVNRAPIFDSIGTQQT